MEYADFLKSKRLVFESSGLPDDPDIHPMLFDFQRDLTKWALRKGRCALFADTGLGKTFMQLEWARLTGRKTLIVAPLSVGKQTIGEAGRLGIKVNPARTGKDVIEGISITNYEMLDYFDAADFGAVVLDESSILKSLDGKTRLKLTRMFERTPFKLCCTATPAPNDIAELVNHAEFLGIMTRGEMLSAFFVHDSSKTANTGGYRLKKHAEEPFYRWLASWGMSVKHPSDLGYSDDGYILPELDVQPVFVSTDYRPPDALFFMGLKGIQHRAAVRKGTVEERTDEVVRLVKESPGQWIVWCGLNDEQDRIHNALEDSVSVHGSQPAEVKARLIEGFQTGLHRVLVTKPKIAGFGLNLQNCNQMVFVGLSDSFESYYQCIRRSWRYGQQKPVMTRIVMSEIEQDIFDNVKRKEREAEAMSKRLVENVREFEREEIQGNPFEFTYKTDTMENSEYKIMLGDSVERMAEIADESIDLSIFSPPFQSLYTYTPSERDLGNSKTEQEFFEHFGFVIDHLLRVTKDGRNCCVHVSQLPARKVHDGFIGLKDFRGDVIRAFSDRGWIYHGEVCIDKDPQVQAVRSKAKQLLFVTLKKDSSWSVPAYADYILIFRKPGDNAVPVHPDLSNEDWIKWARPVWYGIKETQTLNVAEGRDCNDERHICPLQLGVIERCVRLWSNPRELILSPFMGIGSEGYVAIKHKRRFVGIELKESYFEASKRNLDRAMNEGQLNLFAGENTCK